MKDEVVGVLVSFMKDMNKWETSYHDAFMKNHSIDKLPYRDELKNIFERWCTLKDRKTGRQISLKVSFPPDYDPESDEIMDAVIIKNKASVIVKKIRDLKINIVTHCILRMKSGE